MRRLILLFANQRTAKKFIRHARIWWIVFLKLCGTFLHRRRWHRRVQRQWCFGDGIRLIVEWTNHRQIRFVAARAQRIVFVAIDSVRNGNWLKWIHNRRELGRLDNSLQCSRCIFRVIAFMMQIICVGAAVQVRVNRLLSHFLFAICHMPTNNKINFASIGSFGTVDQQFLDLGHRHAAQTSSQNIDNFIALLNGSVAAVGEKI